MPNGRIAFVAREGAVPASLRDYPQFAGAEAVGLADVPACVPFALGVAGAACVGRCQLKHSEYEHHGAAGVHLEIRHPCPATNLSVRVTLIGYGLLMMTCYVGAHAGAASGPPRRSSRGARTSR
eukprot:6122550-Prymnesium_polylepis.1